LVLDPDKHVQQCLRLLFETFRSTGCRNGHSERFKGKVTVSQTRSHRSHKGDLVWAALGHTQVLRILHNPRYQEPLIRTSTFAKTVDGLFQLLCSSRKMNGDADSGSLPGYLSWEDYQQN